MKNKISLKIGRGKAEIFFFVRDPCTKGFINSILNTIPYYKDIGYAGYKSKSALKKFLVWSIFGREYLSGWKSIRKEVLLDIIRKILSQCKIIISGKNIRIFVFPTLNTFIIKNMHGVSGISCWKNTILLNIYPAIGWKTAFEETLVHELSHALALNFHTRRTILDDLIFEGIAEHFREAFIGGKKAEWATSISKQQAKIIFQNLQPILLQCNRTLSKQLFFGTGKYPLWAGYAIGYYLIASYLNQVKNKNWKEILKTPPQEIMSKSKF